MIERRRRRHSSSCSASQTQTRFAGGFILTVATIWVIPVLADIVGWRWAFAFLPPGRAIGVLAMLRLKSLPETRGVAGLIG